MHCGRAFTFQGGKLEIVFTIDLICYWCLTTSCLYSMSYFYIPFGYKIFGKKAQPTQTAMKLT